MRAGAFGEGFWYQRKDDNDKEELRIEVGQGVRLGTFDGTIENHIHN